jgi:hypothetical protein
MDCAIVLIEFTENGEWNYAGVPISAGNLTVYVLNLLTTNGLTHSSFLADLHSENERFQNYGR